MAALRVVAVHVAVVVWGLTVTTDTTCHEAALWSAWVTFTVG